MPQDDLLERMQSLQRRQEALTPVQRAMLRERLRVATVLSPRLEGDVPSVPLSAPGLCLNRAKLAEPWPPLDLAALRLDAWRVPLDALACAAVARVVDPMAPQYHRLDNLWRTWLAPSDEPVERAAARLLDLAEGTQHTQTVQTLTTFALRLNAIASGREDVFSLLIGDGSTELLEKLYGELPESRLLLDAFEAALGRLVPAGAPGVLRVLEVGGGTATATARALRRLSADSTWYLFTDRSPFFFARAKERFGTRLGLAVYNIDRDPIEAGLRPESFDLVLAVNVLHCAAVLDRTLRYLEGLLRPGGALVVAETIRNERWHLCSLALLPGFLSYEDDRVLPLLDEGQWLERLAKAGFSERWSYPEGAVASRVGQQLFVGMKP